jgi:hypothetical protein
VYRTAPPAALPVEPENETEACVPLLLEAVTEDAAEGVPARANTTASQASDADWDKSVANHPPTTTKKGDHLPSQSQACVGTQLKMTDTNLV